MALWNIMIRLLMYRIRAIFMSALHDLDAPTNQRSG